MIKQPCALGVPIQFGQGTRRKPKPNINQEEETEMETTDRKQYTSINQIISEAQRAGSHFFDDSTLRFFSSRILPTIYAGCYFITSERDEYRDSNPRLYTIRKYEGGLRIQTVGNFCQYGTKAQAVSAIKKLIKAEEAK